MKNVNTEGAGVSVNSAARRTAALRISSGDQAPDFSAGTNDGGTVSLSDYSGKAVLLSFFRFASCPSCRFHLHTMMQRYPGWVRDDFQIIMVFSSSAENVSRYTAEFKPEFPLVCDLDRRLYRLYGVEKHNMLNLLDPRSMFSLVNGMSKGFSMGRVDGPMAGLPCDFLINPGGDVEIAHYGRHIGDHISFEKVEKYLGFRLAS